MVEACSPASGPPGALMVPRACARITRVVELARLQNLVADRAAGVDRVEDLLVARGDGVPPGVQVAPDRDEVGVGAERLAEGGAVGAVPGQLEALHDRLRRSPLASAGACGLAGFA